MKCGGSNQTLLPNDLDLLRDGSTMLVGLDVTHPAPKSMTGTPSIAGIVASIDGQYGRYPGNVRCQASRTEMIESLDVLMKERLQLWMLKNNGRKPRNIMIYRDGKSQLTTQIKNDTYFLYSYQVYRKASIRLSWRWNCLKSGRLVG